MMEQVAVLDPECTRTLPPHLAAGTAQDSLTYAIGSLASDQRQDFSNGRVDDDGGFI